MNVLYIMIPFCTLALYCGIRNVARILEAMLIELHRIAEDKK